MQTLASFHQQLLRGQAEREAVELQVRELDACLGKRLREIGEALEEDHPALLLPLSSKMSKISEGAISADGANGDCHQRNCERERRRLAGASPPATLHPKNLSVDPAGSCKISAWQRLLLRQRFACARKRTAVSLAVTSTYCLEQPTSLCSSLPRSEAPGEAPRLVVGCGKFARSEWMEDCFSGSIGLLHYLRTTRQVPPTNK